ncbi:uncharacterized protein A4U43_C03F29160 [Asparagus officinalis]|uniref:protein-serine/threonine phosphatase n=1 Tax=Asparagus officinalis TaxID=4686 RepID=A0A5P1FDQ9_ASPOF|nr:uncharacterized protein A4U43_C03F29160 [Asparagus officinalis]
MSTTLFSFLGFILFILPSSIAESLNCIAVYKEGGAPAVFESPECPRWTFPSADDLRRRQRSSEGCQMAVVQGRRRYQEDRAVCALDIKIPFLERTGIKEISVGIIAIFDGHNGAEASDMASRLLVDYFLLHIYFLLDVTYSVVLRKFHGMLSLSMEPNVNFQGLDLDKEEIWDNFDPERLRWISPIIFDGQFHMETLKESLLRTIHDIDEAFSKEALRKNLVSGTTATVVLLADGQILAANVGDSKSLLCSENFHSSARKGNSSKRNRRRDNYALSPNGYGKFQLAKPNERRLCVKELTRDHHPDRDEEKNRVEAAGGYVLEWAGVPRVNGELAISRAIGDIPFKRYGVVSTPEVTDWQSINNNDSYLLAASDGIFEKMTTQDVCNLLWDEKLRTNVKSDARHSAMHSLADHIVEAGFRKGTVDNMAVIVVPLGSSGKSGFFIEDECDREEAFHLSYFLLPKAVDRESANNEYSTSLMPMEYYNRIISKFNRLLVETENKTLGCFYLSENLNEDVDYVFGAPKDYEREEVHDLHPPFPESLGSYHNIDEIDFRRTFSKNFRKFNLEEGLKHIARYVESFESKAKEIWLVFRNEGLSLSKLIYSAEETKKITGDGSTIRNIQLLAVKSCHDRNITHRDIKPENMIVCFEDLDSGRCLREVPTEKKKYHLKMRVIDFGSAIDEFTLKNLYGSGPTRLEQTFEYSPPEALLNASWFQEPNCLTLKYDMWSVGVVMLELIVGSPHIFQISDRTRALLDQHLEGWSEHTKELAYKLRSYMEMCILIPGVSSRQHQKEPVDHGGGWLASWKCSEESFAHQVKSRDPLKRGFPNMWALRLVRQLLMWHPEDRLSVDDALCHPYFRQNSQPR